MTETSLADDIEALIVELRGPDDVVGISPSSPYAEGWVDAQERAADDLSDLLDEHRSSSDRTYVVTSGAADMGAPDTVYVGQDPDEAKSTYDETVASDPSPRASTTTFIEVWANGEHQYTTRMHPDQTPQSQDD